MKYFYLKFGRSNIQLNYWLDKNKNIFKEPTAVIYFGKYTSEEFKDFFKKDKEEYKLLQQKAEKKHDYIPKYSDLHEQIKPFYKAGETKKAIFITIYKGKIYILAPESEVRDVSHEDRDKIINDLKNFKKPIISTDNFKNDVLKIMHVKILKVLEKDIPYILRTLGTDQYLNRGTCREIKKEKHWGSIQAIKKVLGEREIIPEKFDYFKIFQLLSPHQFETLIFLMFTNAGIFSPAWRAGTLLDIDIIGINYSNKEFITIGTDPSIEFERNKEITFQVKRKQEIKKQKADYTISLADRSNISEKQHFLTPKWVLEVINKQQKTKEWIENSLRWFIEDTDYKSIFELIY